MKRLATLLISLSLLLSLVACGGESTPSNAGTASVSASSGELSENESEEESKGEKEVTFEEITAQSQILWDKGFLT